MMRMELSRTPFEAVQLWVNWCSSDWRVFASNRVLYSVYRVWIPLFRGCPG
jgi:hypothetical protein